MLIEKKIVPLHHQNNKTDNYVKIQNIDINN